MYSEEFHTVEGDGTVPDCKVEEGRPLPAVVLRLHDLDVGVASGGVVEVGRVGSVQKILPKLICDAINFFLYIL